jgi:hypothetical protein
MGDHAAALARFRVALDIRRRALPASHPSLLNNLSDLGQCLIDVKRYSEAEATLLEAFRGLEPLRAQQERVFNGVLERLGLAYRAMGRDDEATKYESMRQAAR